jgi:hypothetical protein
VRLDRVRVDVLDDTRRTIAPAGVLDRVRATWNGVTVATEFDPPTSVAPVILTLPDLMIDPGATDTLAIEIDVDATAPPGSMELVVDGGGLSGWDANLGTPVVVRADTGAALPMSSGLTRIEAAARTLVAGLASLMPVTVVGDGAEVAAGRLTLDNTAPSGSSTIGVDHLDVIASSGSAAFPIGAVCEAVVAYRGGLPWASSGPLSATATQATLSVPTALEVATGVPQTLELRIVPRAGATATFRVGVDQAGVGVVQPGSGPGIAVLPSGGAQFPLWTETTGFSDRTLAGSYSNYPNPFAAGREPTRFVFYVPSAGRATLRIFTARGEPVTTVLDGVDVAPGLRQSDAWDGRNGRGAVVANGVYVAELIVTAADGSRERVLRKLAVVR